MVRNMNRAFFAAYVAFVCDHNYLAFVRSIPIVARGVNVAQVLKICFFFFFNIVLLPQLLSIHVL